MAWTRVLAVVMGIRGGLERCFGNQQNLLQMDWAWDIRDREELRT